MAVPFTVRFFVGPPTEPRGVPVDMSHSGPRSDETKADSADWKLLDWASLPSSTAPLLQRLLAASGAPTGVTALSLRCARCWSKASLSQPTHRLQTCENRPASASLRLYDHRCSMGASPEERL